jgi:carbamate kinase
VVPSPKPLKIVNSKIIKQLVEQGVIVIAAGGGGIPVYIEIDGTYEGVDGVIDKDLASAVLAIEIKAQILAILTAVDYVYLNYKKPDEKRLERITLSEAKKYLNEGHFPSGSMGPKIEAAIKFLESGGNEVIITSLENAKKGFFENFGTKLVPD